MVDDFQCTSNALATPYWKYTLRSNKSSIYWINYNSHNTYYLCSSTSECTSGSTCDFHCCQSTDSGDSPKCKSPDQYCTTGVLVVPTTRDGQSNCTNGSYPKFGSPVEFKSPPVKCQNQD